MQLAIINIRIALASLKAGKTKIPYGNHQKMQLTEKLFGLAAAALVIFSVLVFTRPAIAASSPIEECYRAWDMGIKCPTQGDAQLALQQLVNAAWSGLPDRNRRKIC
ncbi:hypothetical protein ACDH63_15465 [Xanthomonas axonopodis pv. maculifoliigardeniae]